MKILKILLNPVSCKIIIIVAKRAGGCSMKNLFVMIDLEGIDEKDLEEGVRERIDSAIDRRIKFLKAKAVEADSVEKVFMYLYAINELEREGEKIKKQVLSNLQVEVTR